MKKVALSTFVIALFLLYSFGVRNIGSSSQLVASKNTAPKVRHDDEAGESEDGSLAVKPATSVSSRASQTTPQAGQYKDGTYTGPVTDAFYGDLQVRAVVTGGKLSDVKFLKYPNDQENSRTINRQAMPLLRQEAVRAQDAQVDGVSGATDTSIAFVQSLEAALRQAL